MDIFLGIKGILTETRKRMYKQIQQQNKHMSGESEDQAKNPWGALSETWGLNDVVEEDFLPRNGVKDQTQARGIKERLGIKCRDKEMVQVEDLGETSSGSDSDDNWCKRSKIPRMRMHADDEEEKLQKRRAKLRYQVSFLFINQNQ